MGLFLHPRVVFAGHQWLERCEEPSFAVLRPLQTPTTHEPSEITSSCSLATAWKKSIILVTLLLPHEVEGNKGTG